MTELDFLEPLKVTINKIKELKDYEKQKTTIDLIINNIEFLLSLNLEEQYIKESIDDVLKNFKLNDSPCVLFFTVEQEFNDKQKTNDNLGYLLTTLGTFYMQLLKEMLRKIKNKNEEMEKAAVFISEFGIKAKEAESKMEEIMPKIANINEFHGKVKAFHDEAQSQNALIKPVIESMTATQQLTKKSADEVISYNTKTQAIVNELDSKEKQYSNLMERIGSYSKEIEEINAHNKKQQEQIDNTIELANRHGMAGSFKRRKDELLKMQFLWIGLFIVAIAGMLWFSMSVLFPYIKQNDLFNFFTRLPFMGPIFWLAWYSILQFGYTTRIVEDYSYKYATALAFEGYKNNIKECDKDEKLIDELIKVTINIFSQHPVRLYSKRHETTPVAEIVELLKIVPQQNISEILQIIGKVKK